MTIIPDILSQFSARNPFRHELKGIESDTFEEHDIRVVEVFPHHSFLAECLQSYSALTVRWNTLRIRYPFDRCLTVCGIYPEPFDADIFGANRPLIDVTEPTKRDRLWVSECDFSGNLVSWRKSHP